MTWISFSQKVGMEKEFVCERESECASGFNEQKNTFMSETYVCKIANFCSGAIQLGV